jgi:hypothetical protein
MGPYDGPVCPVLARAPGDLRPTQPEAGSGMKKTVVLFLMLIALPVGEAAASLHDFKTTFNKHYAELKELSLRMNTNEVDLLGMIQACTRQHAEEYASGNKYRMYQLQKQIDRLNKAYDACDLVSSGIDIIEISGLFILSCPGGNESSPALALFASTNEKYLRMMRDRLANYNAADKNQIQADANQLFKRIETQARRYVELVNKLLAALRK